MSLFPIIIFVMLNSVLNSVHRIKKEDFPTHSEQLAKDSLKVSQTYEDLNYVHVILIKSSGSCDFASR